MEKNIPIEIVLQDPSDPIVPAPGPSDPTGGETGTTETNIAVPNTDADTNSTNGSNGIFANSTAIASIAILVITVIASIALAVRRYHKRKTSEAGMTRQEKRAMVATSTIAILAITVLLGQLITMAVVQPSSTNAATSDAPTSLDTVDEIQIIANRYDDVSIVATTKNISYATTDTTFGYKIFMPMAGEDANLYLDGDETSEYYFAPTENAGL